MATWIVLGLIVLIGAYLVYLYNDLVRKRQMVREGWSGIDVQLKRPVGPHPESRRDREGICDPRA